MGPRHRRRSPCVARRRVSGGGTTRPDGTHPTERRHAPVLGGAGNTTAGHLRCQRSDSAGDRQLADTDAGENDAGTGEPGDALGDSNDGEPTSADTAGPGSTGGTPAGADAQDETAWVSWVLLSLALGGLRRFGAATMRGDRRRRATRAGSSGGCCGPWLAAVPPRRPNRRCARHTAYALGRVDTSWPRPWRGRRPGTTGKTGRTGCGDCAATRFVGPSVLESPSPVGDRGLVAFAATLSQDGAESVLRERSVFHRRNGAWFYHSGVAL